MQWPGAGKASMGSPELENGFPGSFPAFSSRLLRGGGEYSEESRRRRKVLPFTAALMGSPPALALCCPLHVPEPLVLLTVLKGRYYHPPSYRRHLRLREVKYEV